MKKLINSFFPNKNKNSKINTPALETEGNIPTFKINEIAPHKSDFEVTELSFDEYIKSTRQELIKMARELQSQ